MVATRVVDVPSKLPLYASMNNRQSREVGTSGVDTTLKTEIDKDARLINGYLDKDEATGDVWIVKRPGTRLRTDPLTGPVTPGSGGSGSYSASDQSTFFYIWDGANTKIYRYLGNGVHTYLSNAWVPLSHPDVSYSTEMRYSNGHLLVLASRVGELWTIDTTTNAILQVTSASFPINTCKGVAVLDTTAYVIDIHGDIYGSALTDPYTWNVLNRIAANTEGDAGVTIRKHLTYVVAFKRYSTQIFYDADNPPPGSPLSPVEGAFIAVGCADANGVQRATDDTLIWLAYDRKGRTSVAKLKGLTYSTVSTPAVERLLSRDGSSAASHITVIDGHIFFIITIVNDVGIKEISLAYDIEVSEWFIWTDTQGARWPYSSQTSFGNENQLLQHTISGLLYEFAPQYFLDTAYTQNADYVSDKIVTLDLFTPNFDAGFDRRKLLAAMRLQTDQVKASSLKVRSNDWDFDPDRWTQYRIVDLSVPRPILPHCGSFYRRAYNLRHDVPTKFRIRQIDLQMELGTL